MFERIKKSITFRLQYYLRHNNRLKRLRKYGIESLAVGEIDSLELLELCKKKEECKVIFDVGSNRGTWSVLASHIFPCSVIHAFEPLDIETIPSFQRDQIRKHSIGLGSRNETKTLYITNDVDSSSLLKPQQLQKQTYNSYEVGTKNIAVHKLDDYIITKNLPQPDLIKLDVQGFELEVLKGAEKALEQTRFLILEISFERFYEDQPLFGDIVEYLNQTKFDLKAFGLNTTTGEFLSQTDVLFEKRP
jgi:FkbM family methyltransferase